MFLESNHGSSGLRDGWTYPYYADQLLGAAKGRHELYATLEDKHRRTAAELMKQPASASSSAKLKQLQERIERLARRREECWVFEREFERAAKALPAREFSLRASDVVFFFGDIADADPENIGEEDE